MKTNERQSEIYPFHWLDELVEMTLNPEYPAFSHPDDEMLKSIRHRLPGEISHIRRRLKEQAFSLYRAGQIRVFAGQYDQSIRILLQRITTYLAGYPEEGLLKQTVQYIYDLLATLSQDMAQRHEHHSEVATTKDGLITKMEKVSCRMSVDQIGILLKAADDTHLLTARSFSQILRQIIPHLSTERFADVSWKSARSSVYKMEGSDKDRVIDYLESLILCIRSY